MSLPAAFGCRLLFAFAYELSRMVLDVEKKKKRIGSTFLIGKFGKIPS
jgi:hypothetical protein